MGGSGGAGGCDDIVSYGRWEEGENWNTGQVKLIFCDLFLFVISLGEMWGWGSR